MTAAVVKAVFDTNILVSGHFWKGPPYRCLLAAEARLAVAQPRVTVGGVALLPLVERLPRNAEPPADSRDIAGYSRLLQDS